MSVCCECPPPAAPAFRHFGTQWDWLDFYWGLWTDATDAFSADEINGIWESTRQPDGLPDRAHFCCHLDANDDPDACLPATTSTCSLLAFPEPVAVGYLWTADPDFWVGVGVLDRVQIIYASDPTKRDLFETVGGLTRVNY